VRSKDQAREISGVELIRVGKKGKITAEVLTNIAATPDDQNLLPVILI
jgi:hypothetical protein